MPLKIIYNLLILIVSFTIQFTAGATVVRMDFAIGDQSTGEVYVELLDTDAPVTVANFINYVENGVGERRYDGTFIHRSVRAGTTGIDVIQGGGFVLESGLPVGIQTDADIANEFNPANSNVRGTLAMAKQAGQPDSANSQWFFNVVDNSSALDDTAAPDTQDNGGFTVFGRVLGSGMDTIDAIAAVPTENLGSIFTNVPTVNHPPGDPISDANLVTLLQVVANPPARAFVGVSDLDFGLVGVNDLADQQITIQNIGGTDDLALGSINQPGAPFAIVADQCSNSTLAQTQSCQISVRFQPTIFGDVQDSLTISTSDAKAPVLAVVLRGSGANAAATLEVDPASSIDFGNVVSGEFPEQLVIVRNIGSGDLQPGAPTVSGAGAADFEVLNDGCSGNILALSETCTFTIRLTSNTLGEKSATLSVVAQPAQSVQVVLSAVVAPSQANLFLPLTDGVFDMGDTQSGVTLSQEYPVFNLGPGDLTFFDIALSGADASEFSISHNCQTLSALDTICPVTISFTPAGTGSKSATLELSTNDPANPFAAVPIVATSSQDNDGIPDAIESAAPNGGDGNKDGIADYLQQNVASMPTIKGSYITLVSSIGTRLTGVRADDNPAPETAPTADGVPFNFENGFFYFTIEGVPAGGAATVTMYFPSAVSTSRYFKFSQAANAWFTFDYNPATGIGAEILGDRIILHFLDGQLGDEDRDDTNGIIVDPGGPGTIALDSDTSSSGGCSLGNRPMGGSNRRFAVDLMALLLGLLIWRAIRYAGQQHRITLGDQRL